MNKTWNDSDLARLSADLGDELTAIFDQVEAALRPPDDRGKPDEPDADPLPAISPADLLAEDRLKDLDIDVTLDNASPFTDPAAAETDWLEPGLLGEPEVSTGLTPETVRELSRIIEAAVEKGVAAALAKMKG